jgi:hypothetical protein
MTVLVTVGQLHIYMGLMVHLTHRNQRKTACHIPGTNIKGNRRKALDGNTVSDLDKGVYCQRFA